MQLAVTSRTKYYKKSFKNICFRVHGDVVEASRDGRDLEEQDDQDRAVAGHRGTPQHVHALHEAELLGPLVTLIC